MIYTICVKFVSAICSDNQASFHKTKEVFSLVAKKGTNRNDQMIIHPHALPCPMEWPTTPYYKANGRHLPMPSAWGAHNNDNDEEAIPVKYDFNQVTPVKKFRPSPLKK